jgi:AcrR family transcriptional regulator
MTPPPDPTAWIDAGLAPTGRPTRAADRAEPLSTPRIVAAAVELADAEPHGEITMRALATRLGVRSPMALYRYVGSKEGLADLMADEVYGMVTPTRGQGWREALRSLGLTGWAAVQAHPWFARLAFARPPFGPNALAMYDAALAELEPLGLDASARMGSISTVFGHVLGSGLALLEERAMRARVGVVSDSQLAEFAVGPLAGIAESGRYPHFSRWAADADRDAVAPQSFEQILDWLLDGLSTLTTDR